MTGLMLRRRMGGAAVALAGLASSSAAANAGACDAKKAQALLGKSYSPRLEDRAVALSGASIAALWARASSARRITAPTAVDQCVRAWRALRVSLEGELAEV